MKSIFRAYLILALAVLMYGCDRNFKSLDQCLNYIQSKSFDEGKIGAGRTSCHWSFIKPQTSEDAKTIKTAKCVIANFDEIHDDTSGSRVVNQCSDKYGALEARKPLADHFSSASRHQAKQLQEQDELYERMRRLNEENRKQELGELRPIIRQDINELDINGKLMPCIKIGNTLSCN